MVLVRLQLVASAPQRASVLSALRSLVGPVEAKPGCRSCRFYREIDDPDSLMWVEEWDSRAAMETHIRSDEYRALLSTMELSARQPEIRFDSVASTAGLEFIEATRAHDDGHSRR